MSCHVAVLMGGKSSEREISLRSGRGCCHALEEAGYRVTPVDVQEDIALVLSALRPDVAFNALHGPLGEDGTIQGLLEILQIPYTHSGVLASALALQKDKTRFILEAAGIPVAKGKVVNRWEAAQHHVLPRPYVLKPLNEGSSMGIFIVQEDHSYPPQELTRSDWPYGDLLLAEAYIAGQELTCGVLGTKVLDIIEIESIAEPFYGYEAKYTKGGSIHHLPAKLKPNIYQTIQELTLKTHQALGCRGITRTDFRYDDRPHGTGEIVVLEINTQPGLTETSLFPEMAAYAGLSFPDLMRWMVEDASCHR